MGLFENLGRKVERLKQQAQEASEAEATAECRDCGSLVYSEREDCPDCGSDDLAPRADQPGTEPDPDSDAGSTSDQTHPDTDDGSASDPGAGADDESPQKG
jgi:hypothetical protein